MARPATDATALNKQVAEGFLRLAGSEHKPREAYARYVGPAFIHHNPGFGGSREDLLLAMEASAKDHPGQILDVKHVLADGDLVAVHSHVRPRPKDRGLAVVHIFRIEGGKIVEFWDVGQPVPERSPNANGMF